MLSSLQRYFYSILDVVTLNIHVVIIMHAASVALLLHGVLLASLAGLIIRSNVSAQTLLLIGLLLNIHPKLLSYIQIPTESLEEPSHSVDGVAPIIDEKLSAPQNDTADNFGCGLPITAAIMETDSPTTPSVPRCNLQLSMCNHATLDDNHEIEHSPLSHVAARRATPSIPYRNGLKPLTLSNSSYLDVKDSFGPRRTVSLFNGSKRLSPLFYISDGSREESPPARSSEIPPRRVSLPPDYISRTEVDVTARLRGEIQLTSKLQEEMKLTARLRNDLTELRDRAYVELNQSKYEAQALAVAVDAREYFIKDLAASVEFLRRENKVLKKATRGNLCQSPPIEVSSGRNIDENIPSLSPVITMQEPEQAANMKPGGLNSGQERRLGTRPVKRSSIASGYLSGIDQNLGDSFGDTAGWFSLGSVSEPTLEPSRGSKASSQVSPPPTFPSDNTECCEFAIDTPDGCLEVEFPTISPEVPPCHAAALTRRKLVVPNKGIPIYEVDGRALAATHGHLASPEHSADPVPSRYNTHQAAPRHSSRHLMNNNSDNTCLAANQTCHGDASRLAMQQDSPFYAVPASAFIVPRAIDLLSGRCP